MTQGFTTGRGSRRKFHPTEGGGSQGRIRQSGSSMSGTHRRRGQDKAYPSAGIVHEGELTKHGYHIEESETKRHESLDKAIREDGAGKTVQRLNALAVVNKGNADKHRDLEMDVDYVHGQEYPKTIRDAYPKYQLQEYETVKRLHGKEHADSFFRGKYDRESPAELERIAREKGTIPKA